MENMYKHILLATDLVSDMDPIAEKAAKLAKVTGAKFSIIHVVEPLPSYGYTYIGGSDLEVQLIDESKKGLEKFASQLSMSVENQIVEVGPTKNRILEAVETHGVDLIVLGSHGRHGLSLLLGSTANAVLHGANCDVLTVRLPE